MKNFISVVLLLLLILSAYLLYQEKQENVQLQAELESRESLFTFFNDSLAHKDAVNKAIASFFVNDPATAIYRLDSLIAQNEWDQSLSPIRGDMVSFYEGIMDELNRKDFLGGRVDEVSMLISEREDSVKALASELEFLRLQMEEIAGNYKDEVDGLRNALVDARKQNERDQNRKVLKFKSSGGNDIMYFGEVVNGKANGYGIGLWTNGSTYEGFWKDNLRDGTGTHEWKDGEKYEGAFVKDKRQGFGIYTWANYEKYVGTWENDLRHGQGVIYNKDEKPISGGLWEKDKLKKSQKPDEVLKQMDRNGNTSK